LARRSTTASDSYTSGPCCISTCQQRFCPCDTQADPQPCMAAFCCVLSWFRYCVHILEVLHLRVRKLQSTCLELKGRAQTPNSCKSKLRTPMHVSVQSHSYVRPAECSRTTDAATIKLPLLLPGLLLSHICLKVFKRRCASPFSPFSYSSPQPARFQLWSS
jgi:hypothetical protein